MHHNHLYYKKHSKTFGFIFRDIHPFGLFGIPIGDLHGQNNIGIPIGLC
jgi:hypothetical protein